MLCVFLVNLENCSVACHFSVVCFGLGKYLRRRGSIFVSVTKAGVTAAVTAQD